MKQVEKRQLEIGGGIGAAAIILTVILFFVNPFYQDLIEEMNQSEKQSVLKQPILEQEESKGVEVLTEPEDFIKPEQTAVIPSIISIEEYGFQITLVNPDLWRMSDSYSTQMYVDSNLNREKSETYTILQIEGISNFEHIVEIVIFKPTETTIEEAIKMIHQEYNEHNIFEVKTELQHEVDGLTYQFNKCPQQIIQITGCKGIGEMQFYKQNETLHIVHARSGYDQERNFPLELHNDIVFMKNSFSLLN